MKHKLKKAVKIILSSLIIIVSLYFLQRLLIPKYASDIVEGAMIAEYYQEEKDHDVIFIGDCEVYENFSPQALWDDFGINSYIRGSAQQLIWQSYYILEDTLRYEIPKVVIFNVQSMQFAEPDKEAYNRMTLEGMEWSPSKLKAIGASMTTKESYLDYIFPILRYHSRWSDIHSEDLEYILDTPKVSHNGYYMRVDAKSAENIPEGKPLADYSFGEVDYKYLDMITKLCKVNNIELILIKAPSLYPYWYDQWNAQIEEYAEKNGLLYINFLDLIEEAGLDFDTDTYDAGLHMNLSGAEKIAKYLGKILQQEAGLSDRRQEEELAVAWNEKRRQYEADRDEQYRNLEVNDLGVNGLGANGLEVMAEADSSENTVEESPKSEEAAAEKKDYKGYTFIYHDVVVEIDAEAEPILAQFGEANSYYEAASCAFNGLDKMYTYSSFEVDTYPVDDKDYVSMILFKDDSISTAEGVSIGDSAEKLTEVYGEDSQKENGMIVYTKDGMKLCFVVKGGNIISIEYHTTTLDE